jgi:GntR family transcriptional regulator/MocR family aminotransferase
MKTKRRDLLLVLDKTSSIPLYRQIYCQVCEAIARGELTEGERLPSIRKLSANMQLSHTTVEQAYLQLSIEGYVTNIPRSGYAVERLDAKFLSLPKKDIEPKVRMAEQSRSRDAFFAENAQGGTARYDFSYANLQPDSFPVKTWRQLVNDVLYTSIAPDFARYSYTDKPNELRVELARYLGRARGVNCTPEQVVIQAGTDGSIATLLQLFDRDRHFIGMEEPGYATVHEVARRHGFQLAPIPTDQGADVFIEALYRHKPKIVFTTPSHQFPTGAILSLDARIQLLKWAQENNSYIIEDDSCNEYRYGTSPIPSLQSLDAYNRVIYLCGVSKVLSPSMRIAYLVLPPKLLGRYYRFFNTAHPSVALLEQEVLARFIKAGYWEQHIHRMAVGNRKRHAVLMKCLEEQMGDKVSISGANSGMHLFVTVHNGMTQDELMGSARKNNVAIYGTKRFWFSKTAPENRIMIGFSAIDIDDIPPGISALRHAWLPGV